MPIQEKLFMLPSSSNNKRSCLRSDSTYLEICCIAVSLLRDPVPGTSGPFFKRALLFTSIIIRLFIKYRSTGPESVGNSASISSIPISCNHPLIHSCRVFSRPSEGQSRRCVALRCVALRCVALRCVALRCVALRCVALRCVALRCVALRCVALRCVALRCVALRCVALRCVQIISFLFSCHFQVLLHNCFNSIGLVVLLFSFCVDSIFCVKPQVHVGVFNTFILVSFLINLGSMF